MGELTWENILESQQRNFILSLKEQLKFSPNDIDFLSRLESSEEYGGYSFSFSCEQVNLYFPEYYESEIDEFCYELTVKYEEYSHPDAFINYKIGKIGEEAVWKNFHDILTSVNYDLHYSGDGGVDFYLKNNTSITIQVKTTSLFRISWFHIEKENLTPNDCEDILWDFHQTQSDYINSVKWKIGDKDKNQNKIVIFVLLLNPIEGDRIIGNGYKCVIAGFQPTNRLNINSEIKIENLLYSGGIRAYLEHLK